MAVYTRLTDDELATLMQRFGLGVLHTVTEIAEGVENSNFLILAGPPGQPPTRYILTLFEKRVDISQLPFFLGLTRHLAESGLPTPRPLLTQDGAMFTSIAGKMAAVVTFLEGRSITRPDTAHLHALGGMQAQLHLAAQRFTLQRPNGLARDGWHTLIGRIGPRADDIAPGLAAMLQEEFRFLEEAWPVALPAGVIHADLFPDNVFFLDHRISGVIDFYFACNDLLMYDAVITVNAWCFEPDGAFNLTKARSFLHAYEQVRPLHADERAALPVLARGAALRFLLTRAHDWLFPEAGALVRPKDPMEYVRKLRFHQQVKDACEYGL